MSILQEKLEVPEETSSSTVVNGSSGAEHLRESPSVSEDGMSGETERVIVIRPKKGLATLDLQELWNYRDLWWVLGQRDVKLRYRQTALGAIWVIIQPLMAAGIFALVFNKVAKFNSDPVPYFLFTFTSMLTWNVFSTTLSKTSTCLLGNSQLVSKIYFPRLILPLSVVNGVLLDFAVAFVLLAILLPLNGIFPHIGFLLLPVCLLIMLMMALGVGLYAAALTVSYRDIQYIIPVVVNFLLYLSPVGYAFKMVEGKLQMFYLFNPLTGVLETTRWSLLGYGEFPVWLFFYSLVSSIVLFVSGLFAFRNMERRFADVI